MNQSRFDIGLERLNHIDGEAGQQVIESLQDISPDLAKYTIEYPFGDIYSRPGLDLKITRDRDRRCPYCTWQLCPSA